MIGLHFREQEFDAIPAEVTHVRIWDAGAHWSAIHTSPGVFDWARLDYIVDRCKGRHITYVIAATPRWLAKYPDQAHFAPWLGQGSNSMPYDIDEFNDFCWQVATRYKGRIKAYEIWNEPQLADFLYPWNETERNCLAQMTKRAYSTIRSCDSKALVLAASVLPRDSSGGMSKGKKYWDALKKKGWPVDAFTCHIYPEVGKGYKRWKAMLDNVASTLEMMDPPTEKLWITEMTYGLLGDPIPDSKAEQLVYDTYQGDGNRFTYWYAWQRTDLGGMLIAPGTGAWDEIRRCGA